jgi:serine/threonine protein kinase
LTRIESKAFYQSSLRSILFPSSILFIGSDGVKIASQVWFVDGNSCPEFDRWLRLKSSGIAIDFRRIQRVGSGLPSLRDYLINLSTLEERSMIGEFDEFSTQIYDRVDDQISIVVKSLPLSKCVEKSQIENEIEHLINLGHPCICAPIGFVFPIASGSPQELKIVRLYLEGCSLAEVISVNPVWWTSTVKAKAIAGIVLALRFAHSLGLLHGGLTASNIFFDSNDRIQIVDFKRIVLKVDENKGEEGTKLGGFSGTGWTPITDVHAFALLLFDIVVGRPANGEPLVPTGIPNFVSRIIKSVLSPVSRSKYSFHDIFELLKQNDFQIEEGVDSAEVSAFVSWVESAEQPEK